MTALHTAWVSEQRIVVYDNEGWNAKMFANNPNFVEKRDKMFSDQTESVAYQVPSNCTPLFAATDPLKQRMLDGIDKSVIEELMLFNKCCRTHYPRTLKLVIANFDTDYDRTYILLPNMGEIWTIVFYGRHFEDSLSKYGSYLMAGQMRAAGAKELRAKILKYGIVHTITLGEGNK